MKTLAKKKTPQAATRNAVQEIAIERCTDLRYGNLVEGRVRQASVPGRRAPAKPGKEIFFYSPKPYTPGGVIRARLLEEKRPDVFLAQPTEEFSKPEAIHRQVKDFFKAIPKTEIHLHYEGCIRKETFLALARRNPKSGVRTPQDVEKLFTFHNLGEFIRAFVALQENITELADFERLFDDLRAYLKKNRILYSEIFLAVTKFLQKGFAYTDIISTLTRCIRDFEKRDGYKVRLLVDVSRTFGPENAEANLAHVLAHPNEFVIGIGLGGDENKGPAPLFKATFRKAAKAGLHVVAHAGEDVGPESIRAALKDLGVERLGHGMAAIEDDKLMDELARKQVPIELCLTSNVFTGRYTRTLSSHPAQVFHPRGLFLTVNSDDPTFFKTDLSTELEAFHRHLHFPIADILKFVENGVMASFHPEKKALWRHMASEIEKIKKKHPLVIV